MRYHQTLIAFVVILSLIFSCKKNPDDNSNPPPPPPDKFFIRGLDLSFTPEISEYSINYYDVDTVKPILQLVKDKGINTIRVRLWYQPATVHSSLTEVLSFAQEIKANGFKFWLDIHYSDTWTDPSQQTKPAAWSGVDFDQLKDSVSGYTSRVMNALVQENATPDFVQIGNETNDGMLWPEGKIFSNGNQWDQFMQLFEAGATAAKTAAPNCRIIIHYAGLSGGAYYFSNLVNYSSDFDIIGLSYYPAWHGKELDSVTSLIQQLNNLLFNKPVVIAETAYPFTLGWNDYTNNPVGLQSQLIPEYPATPEGQANFVSALVSVLHSNSPYDNSGVCYWAPDWVAFKGPTAYDGSTWENMALFDFSNKALPALDSLGNE